MKLRNPPSINLGHIGMQERRRLIDIGNEVNQQRLPFFEKTDFVLQDGSRDAVEDRLDGLIELAFDALELIPPASCRGVALHPKLVHLSRKLVAERLK
ncbi:hypothetical protein NDN01_18680 [Sphingomonas sp. QA11]|uniref:hypothetical protein n=1 Tax=Sphingomonas sp. QA11 TaxID=2950605 RepID=UPI0023495381|nr:hypothetical protein [Sphingomonas sp. QA11]WCM26028.1 hypothetical protein NDN01_18680 [Sphingomonas sp. QA11]